MATNKDLVSIEDYTKLQFRNQYEGANRIHVRAGDGRLYPTTKEGIIKRISISGLKSTDVKFFTHESLELAKKKS